ncbi:MAG: ABC transporter permease [Alphaproteobacteria bacterium]|nr:ABC transporter permease [Alphaproteobacteria bacterium]
MTVKAERLGRSIDRAYQWAFRSFLVLAYAFLALPIVLILLMALNAGELLEFPPKGMSLRWFVALFDSEIFIKAILTSLQVAAVATCVSGLLGTAAALYFVRHAHRFREALRVLMIAPLLLPEILTAIALLFFVHQIGVGNRGGFGLYVGHTMITLPFVFLNVSAVLYNFDRSIELAARSLGGRTWTVFRRITLPMIKPGVFAGCMFAFVVSFDLFAVSLLLKGIGQSTIPIQLYDYLRWDFDPLAAAVSSVSILISLGVVLLADRIVGLRALRF